MTVYTMKHGDIVRQPIGFVYYIETDQPENRQKINNDLRSACYRCNAKINTTYVNGFTNENGGTPVYLVRVEVIKQGIPKHSKPRNSATI